jgi:hypothetical protein
VPLAVCTVVPKITRFHPVLHRGLTVLAYHNLFPRIPRQLAKRLSTRNPCCPAFVTHHRSRTCSTNRMRLMHSNASGQPQVQHTTSQHHADRWKGEFTSHHRSQHANKLFKYFCFHNCLFCFLTPPPRRREHRLSAQLLSF